MDLDNIMLSFQGGRDRRTGKPISKAELIEKTVDPVFSHTQPLTPQGYNMQYPLPLDPTEIMPLCEEISAVRNIPVVPIDLKNYQWMEATNLYMDAGQYLFFADGECPEEYTETGTYHTTYLKNYGVIKHLTVMDIKESTAIAGMGGINRLIGMFAAGEREPGGYNLGTFMAENIANIKEKEVRKGMSLTLDGLDWTLIRGNAATDPLEFTGLEPGIAACADEHTNTSCPTGTFSADAFDRFISEGCAKPQVLWGHPLALQNVAMQYFQLGWQGSQGVHQVPGISPSPERITPGYGFADAIFTQVGRLPLIADANFQRTAIAGDCGGLFRSIIYPLRMVHNGEPLIYRPQQFPLSYQDLNPGCTAISFEIWGREALTIKACCAQGAYTAQFNGNVVTTCTRIGSLGPGRTGGAPILT